MSAEMEVKNVKEEDDSDESTKEESISNATDFKINESELKPTWRDSSSTLLSSRSYMVFLLTAWVSNSLVAIWYFFNLYLRALQWNYIIIGIVLTVVSLVSTSCRLIGGYVGDIWDRRKLSSLAMFITALYHIIIGIFTDFFLVFIGMIIYATLDIAKSGSSAYLLENIPKKHSGFGISLFTAGRSLGSDDSFIIFLSSIGGENDHNRLDENRI